jgi:hypothetical protein
MVQRRITFFAETMSVALLNQPVAVRDGDSRRAAEILTLDGESTGTPKINAGELKERLRARYYGAFCVRVAQNSSQRGRADLVQAALEVALELFEREGNAVAQQQIRAELKDLLAA